ncbi:MAG: DinB family protein [Armatimonadetes bacterium]|nr:DinB family protein [Armatimonadota bacterium]
MNPYLFPSLDKGPIVIERLLGLITPDKVDRPTHPGRFTPREVVAHLADWEPILLGRMKAALLDSGSSIEGIDEGERALAMNYASLDWRAEAGAYADRRNATIAWLRNLSEGDWDKFVVHSERGKQTICDQANLLLGHDLYHIEQVLDAAVGRSVGTW